MEGSASTRPDAAELRGIKRAEEELAKLLPPPDQWLYAPDGTPWCRYGVGTTDCINGPDCLNPHHNIPTCKRCGWQWDGSGAPPNACRVCLCAHCRWQWPGNKEREHPCDRCKSNIYLEPADLKDPWNVETRIRKDGWGRYVEVHPITGKDTHFTRMTTAADALEDKYGIIDWRCRNVAFGMGLRPDLVNMAIAAEGIDDKDTLNDVVRQAEQAAAANRPANVGTTLHLLTQRIDRGETVRVPDDLRDRVTRYKTAVAQHRLKFILDYIEAVVCIADLNLCGTMDRGAEWPHSTLPIIYDLKTGSLAYAKVKIAQQLAGYANASHRWVGPGKWEPLPAFNRDIALVMHLPDGDAEPVLYKVNIKEGWRLLNMSMDVRSLRSGKGKHLFTEITADAQPSANANREEELRGRVERIVAVPAAKVALLGLWTHEIPTLKEGGLSEFQLDQVADWCSRVERDHSL